MAKERQDADGMNGGAGDPNMAGWASTGSLLDPMAGPLDPDEDNECYKDFLFNAKSPTSALVAGFGDKTADHDPPGIPAVVRRPGGTRSGI